MAKAARALAGRNGETLTRWDVLRQRFPLGPRGYATNEVDAFLVRLAAQFPDPEPAAQEILRKLVDRARAPDRLQARRSTTTTGSEVGLAALTPALDGHGDLLVTGHRPVQGAWRPPSRPRRPARPAAAPTGRPPQSW